MSHSTGGMRDVTRAKERERKRKDLTVASHCMNLSHGSIPFTPLVKLSFDPCRGFKGRSFIV